MERLPLQSKAATADPLSPSVIDTPQLGLVLAYGHLSHQVIHI